MTKKRGPKPKYKTDKERKEARNRAQRKYRQKKRLRDDIEKVREIIITINEEQERFEKENNLLFDDLVLEWN